MEISPVRFQDADGIIDGPALAVVANLDNGILGLGIGRKDQGSIEGGGDFCITVFVERKIRPDDLPQNRRLAIEVIRSVAPNLLITDSDVDVVAVGDEFRAQPYSGSDHSSPASANTQKWFNSLRPGISITNPASFILKRGSSVLDVSESYPLALKSGTIGFFLESKNYGGDITKYLVSCNHVIAGSLQTSGSGPPPFTSIVQPSTSDMNGRDITSNATITAIAMSFGVADLRSWIPLQMYAASASTPPSLLPPVNFVDAAMAELGSSRDQGFLGKLPYGGRLAKVASRFDWDTNKNILIGSGEVFKVGRTTGFTEGTVTAIKAVTRVSYANGMVAMFLGQLAISSTNDNTGPFSLPGDSGAPLMNSANELVGMIFSGAPARSLANPAGEVISALEAVSGIRPLTLVV